MRSQTALREATWSEGEHFLHLEPEVKKVFLENGRRKCLDLKESHVSGGTLDDKEEHLIIVRWQHCEELREEDPSLICATGTEKTNFFDNVKIQLEIGNNYIDYKEVETDKAIKTRGVETLLVNAHLNAYKNTKGSVTLSPNVGIFMDNWMSVYEEFDKDEYEYLTVDEWKQEPAEP